MGDFTRYGEVLEQKAEIGRLVKDTLERHGFVVAWNGGADTRLEIPDLDWKRRTKSEGELPRQVL